MYSKRRYILGNICRAPSSIPHRTSHPARYLAITRMLRTSGLNTEADSLPHGVDPPPRPPTCTLQSFGPLAELNCVACCFPNGILEGIKDSFAGCGRRMGLLHPPLCVKRICSQEMATPDHASGGRQACSLPELHFCSQGTPFWKTKPELHDRRTTRRLPCPLRLRKKGAYTTQWPPCPLRQKQ